MKKKYVLAAGMAAAFLLSSMFLLFWLARAPVERKQPAQTEPPDLSDLQGLDKQVPPLIERIAELKTKEAVQAAKILTDVLRKYSVPLTLALDKLDERNLAPINAEADWQKLFERVPMAFMGPYDSLADDDKTPTKKAHDLCMDLALGISQKGPSCTLRFQAANWLVLQRISGISDKRGPLPKRVPTPEQIVVSAKSAFEKLFSSEETNAQFDVMTTAGTAFFQEGLDPPFYYFWALAEISPLADGDLTALLRREHQWIVEGAHQCFLKAKSQHQKKTYEFIKNQLAVASAVDFPDFIPKYRTTEKELDSFLRSWLKAINDDDSQLALTFLGAELREGSDSKPLIADYSLRADAKFLEFRSITGVTPTFDKKEKVDWGDLIVSLSSFEVTANNQKHAVEKTLFLVRRQGKWHITKIESR